MVVTVKSGSTSKTFACHRIFRTCILIPYSPRICRFPLSLFLKRDTQNYIQTKKRKEEEDHEGVYRIYCLPFDRFGLYLTSLYGEVLDWVRVFLPDGRRRRQMMTRYFFGCTPTLIHSFMDSILYSSFLPGFHDRHHPWT